MAVPLDQIDAFAEAPFTGNPAAVALLEAPADPAWMQAVAAEMNLSETAFVVPAGAGRFHLRWFTPGAEVELCGHATLAAAHALWRRGRAGPSERIRFETRFAGPLTCRPDGAAIAMSFPADRPARVEPPAGLLAALGDPEIRACAASRHDYLLELPDAEAVRRLAPDLAALRAIAARGVIVTAPGDPSEADFVSRFFAPRLRVAEDPVTGSAHCVLGPYWGPRLGRHRLVGRQLSARGGRVGVSLEPGGERLELSGGAVTILAGELLR